jgi:hypothetical protein
VLFYVLKVGGERCISEPISGINSLVFLINCINCINTGEVERALSFNYIKDIMENEHVYKRHEGSWRQVR